LVVGSGAFRTLLPLVVLGSAISGAPAGVRAEDGYDLWLRYRPMPQEVAEQYRQTLGQLVVRGRSPTLRIVEDEIRRGLAGMLGENTVKESTAVARAVVAGTPESEPRLAVLRPRLDALAADGYVIRTMTLEGGPSTVIAAKSDVGVLYGAFHFLRLLQTRAPIDRLDITESSRVRLRMLNHWDNLDGTVERGYAGASLWDWHKLPDYLDPRYADYARAAASLGINATVLNNVNAKAVSLTPAYLEKTAAIANVFRPYGLRVFLCARFSAPIEIGGLATADPSDAAVRAWWKEKAAEIYRVIPDFGGFVVKANSEGQPGPHDYGRSHADGANMLADALASRGGVLIWRAFVYSNERPDDRAKQAYDEFEPLDGSFRDNVLVQVKNGPIDFQPREPFHPLFGAMEKTPLALELQITKEYLGFATHLVYLGSLYEEVLRADTRTRGERSAVAKIIDGSLHGQQLTAIAGVSNTGADRNWSGSHFDQANWYAFGRLAWNPMSSARAIAEEWVRMTFSNDERFVAPVVDMMLMSHQAAVDYMTPLGLNHLMARGHHYGPGPWVDDAGRADWNSVYFHRASERGIGFDRTTTGSNAIAQYAAPVRACLADLTCISEDLLLWFHHVSWDYRTRSGRTLWAELVHRYTRGVERVREMRRTWDSLSSFVDAERHDQVAAFLGIQEQEAKWWRDACLAYFAVFSQRSLPPGYAPPQHSLAYYKSLQFPYAPGHH
jgi:alpha-glucuronidase